jgi:hypothetical protein
MMRKRRNEIQNQPLQPSQQANNTGCMYHSFVSLTGETALLQHASDNCWYRFLIRVMDAGYLLIPIYCNHDQNAEQSGFWQLHSAKCANESAPSQRLLITCKDLGTGGTLHVIAVILDFARGHVTVADPMLATLISYTTLRQFFQETYATKAVEIAALESAVLEDYQPIPPISPSR